MILENIILHSTALNETEKKRLQRAINEELAINAQVTQETEKIYRQFLNAIKEKKFTSVAKRKNYTLKTIQFTTNVFKEEVTFVFYCYNVLNTEEYESLGDRFGFDNGALTEENKIEIVVGFLLGSLRTNVKAVLQHEIEHLFQITKRGILNTYGLGERGKKAYQMAYQVLRKENVSPIVFDVAYVIYTQSESETDAFANQLYQELNASDRKKDVVIKNSNAFLNYKNGRRFLRKIAEDRALYEPIVESFGLTYDEFMKTFKKLNNRVLSKIGKVITKYDQENPPEEMMLNNINDKIDKKI